MDSEKRLARLEEQMYFQENALKELNDALFAQQRQIDLLENALRKSAERERRLMELLAGKAANDLPPHFMPERY